MNDSPRYLVEAVSLTLDATFGPAHQYIPPHFFRTTLYRDVLRNLDPANIPAAKPCDRREWCHVVNAVEGILAVAEMLLAYDTSAPPKVYERILSDTLPAILEWLVYLDPRKHHCDEDERVPAMASFGWSIPDARGQCWLYDAICRFLCDITWIPGGAEALVRARQVSVTSYMFDIWWLRVKRHADNKRADVRTNVILGVLISYKRDLDTRNRIPREIFNKGMPAVRMIIRRLRAVATMPDPDFDEASPLVALSLALAERTEARPLLRPLLWLVVPLLRLIHLPAVHRDAARIDPQSDLESYAEDCFAILLCMASELCGTRDVIRLVRGGLLQAASDHLTRRHSRRNRERECNVVALIAHIIGPALVFPSVARVVRDTLSRHNLRFSPADNAGVTDVPHGDPNHHIRSSDLYECLEQSEHARAKYHDEVKDLMYCHNDSCEQRHGKLKRCPCGYAYYCCESCQAADRPRHKATCRPVITSKYSHDFKIDRPSDIHFIKFFAKQVVAERIDVPGPNPKDQALKVDFSRSMQAVIAPVEDAEGRILYVQVGVRGAEDKDLGDTGSKTTLEVPM
ncbi:hypothetical protein EV714DRAFT_218013 [Schizophyllum commune]